MPAPVYFAGQRLPASYANFYIANKIVLVPTFNDSNDRVALNTLAKLFPGREVVGIACRDLVLGLGTLHCTGSAKHPHGDFLYLSPLASSNFMEADARPFDELSVRESRSF